MCEISKIAFEQHGDERGQLVSLEECKNIPFIIKRVYKVLFAADELTGLIGAAALMRPSKSTKDMELKSLKKKYKSKGFAAGCSREVIERGADQLGWELDKLLEMTLRAMSDTEDALNKELSDEQLLQIRD